MTVSWSPKCSSSKQWLAATRMCAVAVLVILLGCAESSEEVSHQMDAVVVLPPKKRMHVVAVSIPAYGHFMPIKGIAERLLQRGHRVTLLVEFPEWCHSELAQNVSYNCYVLPPSRTFTKDLFARMSAADEVGATFSSIFDEMFRHHREQLATYVNAFSEVHSAHPVDLILMDLSTLVGFSLSAKFGIPRVSLLPLTLNMPVGPSAYMPVLGSAFPRRMSTGQRLLNVVIRNAVALTGDAMIAELNDARRVVGVPPLRSAFELAGLDSLVFAPTIWGYDIPHPVCPNVVALGAFSPSVAHTPLEPSLAAFLDRCERGTVYVNFGTLAVVGQPMFERVQEALLLIASAGYCVAWKVVEDERRAALEQWFDATNDSRRSQFFVSKRFSNPIDMMRHRNMHVFLTHCGDTSVLEAIQAELPLAGIPFFADQADVCQRIAESHIGEYVGHKRHFTVPQLAESLLRLADRNASSDVRRNIRNVRRMSDSLGGAERGAQIVEERWERDLLTPTAFAEQCAFLRGDSYTMARLQEYDIYLAELTLGCLCWWVVWKGFRRIFMR